MGNNNTLLPDLGSSRRVFFFLSFFFYLSDFSDSYILHLPKGVMLKLILALCLWDIAVLAKPFTWKTKWPVKAYPDVSKWDDGSCKGIPMPNWTSGGPFACVKGVGYYCKTWGKDGIYEGLCHRSCRNEKSYYGYEWKEVVHNDNKVRTDEYGYGHSSVFHCDLQKEYAINPQTEKPYFDPEVHNQCVVENENLYVPCPPAK